MLSSDHWDYMYRQPPSAKIQDELVKMNSLSPRPAAPGTEERGAEEPAPQPRRRSGSPATEPSGPGAKLDPPDPGPQPAQTSSPLEPDGARWGEISAPGLLDRAAGQLSTPSIAMHR
jgi:hypothetical protein